MAAFRKAAQVGSSARLRRRARRDGDAAAATGYARAASKRRPGAELSALGEPFFEALNRKPGETMVMLSAEVGASPQ